MALPLPALSCSPHWPALDRHCSALQHPSVRLPGLTAIGHAAGLVIPSPRVRVPCGKAKAMLGARGSRVPTAHCKAYPPPTPGVQRVLKKYGPNGRVRWTRRSVPNEFRA